MSYTYSFWSATSIADGVSVLLSANVTFKVPVNGDPSVVLEFLLDSSVTVAASNKACNFPSVSFAFAASDNATPFDQVTSSPFHTAMSTAFNPPAASICSAAVLPYTA